MTRLTSAEARRVVAAYAKGASSSDLAKRFQCSVPTILRAVRRGGGTVRGVGYPRMFHLADEELRREYEETSIEAIGRKYKVSRPTVVSALKQAGIPRRPAKKLPDAEILLTLRMDRSVREIATVYGATPAAVRSAVKRARAGLAQ